MSDRGMTTLENAAFKPLAGQLLPVAVRWSGYHTVWIGPPYNVGFVSEGPVKLETDWTDVLDTTAD